jgi:hypothetical protein
LHLETQDLFLEAIHVVAQLFMALLHGLFIELQSRDALPLSHPESDGGLAVPLSDRPCVFVLCGMF